ncbi:hypothetical protein RQP46_008088 [Phenoliferia psychrophenolica]
MATIHSLAPEILADIFELAHDPHTPSTIYIPGTITDLSITLYVPNAAGDLPRAFATVQNLHHLTLRFDPAGVPRALNPPSSLFQSLAGSLPTSIKRLSIANVRGATDRTHLALSEVSLPEIQELFSHNRLPELARLDFADCKRKDLEDEAAAADLLAECDRRSIRVVCWEELL